METRQSRRRREEQAKSLQLVKSKSPSPPPPPNSSTKKHTTRKRLLQTFSKTVKNSPKFAQLIRNLCSSNSGSCLTFGKYVKPTKKLFNNFNDFQYADPDMRMIGKPSVNGFVYEIAYEHHGVRAHTILKCPKGGNDIDNLYYEYLIGHFFINDCYLKFPCFLETYGAYHVDTPVLSEMASSRNSYPVKNLENSMTKFKTFQINNGDELTNQLRTSCETLSNICILNQHISASSSMQKYVNNITRVSNDLPQLIYQIYAPLAMLGNTFTHYDLHMNNVLLYNLGKDKFIQMNYIYPDVTVSFKTNLIAKIIDYGRSYFYTDENMNSEIIRKKVCQVCDDCGKKSGYSSFDKTARPDHNVNHIPNISHDLRFMKLIRKNMHYMNGMSEELKKLLNEVRYDDDYGTKERESSPNSSNINNIYDAQMRLKELLVHPTFQTSNNQQYSDSTSIGTLDVYMDSSRKSMMFHPTTDFQKHKTDYVYDKDIKEMNLKLPATSIQPKDLKIGKTYTIVKNNKKHTVAVFDSVDDAGENTYEFIFKLQNDDLISIEGYNEDEVEDEEDEDEDEEKEYIFNPYADGVVFEDGYRVYNYEVKKTGGKYTIKHKKR